MRVVIDTNVLVSRHLSPNGTPALVFALWEAGDFELVLSEAILAEYGRVLAYQHIQRRDGMSSNDIEQVVADFRSFATVVDPTEAIRAVVDDPSDDTFVEAAVAGRCGYVVSGDPHLLRLGEYRGIQMVTPAVFLAVLESLSDPT